MKAKYTFKFTSQATVQSPQLYLSFVKSGREIKGVHTSDTGNCNSNNSNSTNYSGERRRECFHRPSFKKKMHVKIKNKKLYCLVSLW